MRKKAKNVFFEWVKYLLIEGYPSPAPDDFLTESLLKWQTFLPIEEYPFADALGELEFEKKVNVLKMIDMIADCFGKHFPEMPPEKLFVILRPLVYMRYYLYDNLLRNEFALKEKSKSGSKTKNKKKRPRKSRINHSYNDWFMPFEEIFTEVHREYWSDISFVLYDRVSEPDQVEALTRRKYHMFMFCHRYGLHVEGYYCDIAHGYSNKLKDRKQLYSALDHAGQVRAIVLAPSVNRVLRHRKHDVIDLQEMMSTNPEKSFTEIMNGCSAIFFEELKNEELKNEELKNSVENFEKKKGAKTVSLMKPAYRNRKMNKLLREKGIKKTGYTNFRDTPLDRMDFDLLTKFKLVLPPENHHVNIATIIHPMTPIDQADGELSAMGQLPGQRGGRGCTKEREACELTRKEKRDMLLPIVLEWNELGESARSISRILKEYYDEKIDHTRILRWLKKCGKNKTE